MAARKDRFSWPGKLFWLAWGIVLVGQGNRIEAIQNLPDVRFLFLSLPTPLPKREYNAVPTVVDEDWQYRTGGNLTIFDKDHDTMEDRSRTAAAKQSVRYDCHVQLVAIRWG